MTVSHTSAQMTISRLQPGEIYLDAGDSMTLHVSHDVRIRLGDALLSEDLAVEVAAMRKLVAVAAQAAGELDRRAAVKPPAGETANALSGPDTEVAPASSTRPDTQLPSGLSGHSPAGPAGAVTATDPVKVSYMACGDQYVDQVDGPLAPGTGWDCPRHGQTVVVDRASWTAAALNHPDDPGDSGPEMLPAPAEAASEIEPL